MFFLNGVVGWFRGILGCLLNGCNGADIAIEAAKEEKEKEKLLQLIAKTNKYLKEAEDELKVRTRVCIRLKDKTDSGITNAKHLRNEERAKKKLAFKAKEVGVVRKCLDSLVDELNDVYGCNYTEEDIMNLEISDSHETFEEDEKKELLNQLPSIKKQWEEAKSERKVCRDTWFQLKEAREKNPALKKNPEENEKFKAAIENFRSAQEKESAALAAYESLVDKLGVLYDNQDDTISFSDDDEIHYGDGESES